MERSVQTSSAIADDARRREITLRSRMPAPRRVETSQRCGHMSRSSVGSRRVLDAFVALGLGAALSGACFAAGWRAAAHRSTPPRPPAGARMLRAVAASPRIDGGPSAVYPVRVADMRRVSDRSAG
jgi:hypothetical protein